MCNSGVDVRFVGNTGMMTYNGMVVPVLIDLRRVTSRIVNNKEGEREGGKEGRREGGKGEGGRGKEEGGSGKEGR